MPGVRTRPWLSTSETASSKVTAACVQSGNNRPDFLSLAKEEVICKVLRNRSARREVSSRLSMVRSDNPNARATTTAIGKQSTDNARPQHTIASVP